MLQPTYSRWSIEKRKLQKEHFSPLRKGEKATITRVTTPYVVDRFDFEEAMEEVRDRTYVIKGEEEEEEKEEQDEVSDWRMEM